MLLSLQVILVLDTVEPLDRMPDDGRHAVIIEDATFAWSKVASNTEEDKTAAKEAEREVGEDGKIDDKPAGTSKYT